MPENETLRIIFKPGEAADCGRFKTEREIKRDKAKVLRRRLERLRCVDSVGPVTKDHQFRVITKGEINRAVGKIVSITAETLEFSRVELMVEGSSKTLVFVSKPKRFGRRKWNAPFVPLTN